ncbi:hypothetical protein AAE478_005401 [Parahypoxylon ruwenzoriense]
MTDREREEIIRSSPIGNSLDGFHVLFNSICQSRSVPCSPEALDQLNDEDVQDLVSSLLAVLRVLPIARRLPSGTGRGTLRNGFLTLISAVASNDFNYECVRPLLEGVISKKPDEEIWTQVYHAITESTTPPRPMLMASSLQQTPWLRNTSSFVNSVEYRKHVDAVLKEELGAMYVGLHRFHEAYFGGVVGLTTAAQTVFEKCTEGSNPLFRNGNGWIGWPQQAKEKDVLRWFEDVTEQLLHLSRECGPLTTAARRFIIALPNQPLEGLTAERKLDVGFVNGPQAKNSRYHWSQILVPGKLKSNPDDDKASKAWLDIGRCVRQVFCTQDTRRFVIAFTLCGPFMRIWAFDRLGGIASDQFDINRDGLRFVSTILGFLWMNEEQLGFDPTIITSGGKRYIEIDHNGSRERLVIDTAIRRSLCVVGRATTCWKAHREGDTNTPLVIKDTWQYTERGEEGELLREATNRGVFNLGRYYYHYTVQVSGTDDDVRSNVRRGLDITTAGNYLPERSTTPRISIATVSSREGCITTPSRMRPASRTDALLLSSKRSCSASTTTKMDRSALPNRIHRRLIIRDYGKPIYEASSCAALLSALKGCIIGHESLHKAGILHRDISINNLMINEDSNSSWSSFLIDLDLAIKEQQESASGTKEKAGTRAFMAIGVLLGEQHSFMHDLESFFWVLFWICVHYNGPGKNIGRTEFESWNYEDDAKLARSKKGIIDDEVDFLKVAEDNFTAYYRSLIPWVNRLRGEVFPDGRRRRKEDSDLYYKMQQVLQAAWEMDQAPDVRD